MISQTCWELGLRYIGIKKKKEDRKEWKRVVGRQYQSDRPKEELSTKSITFYLHALKYIVNNFISQFIMYAILINTKT